MENVKQRLFCYSYIFIVFLTKLCSLLNITFVDAHKTSFPSCFHFYSYFFLKMIAILSGFRIFRTFYQQDACSNATYQEMMSTPDIGRSI